MVAETALRPAELVLPVFVKEGLADPQPISSMPGVFQHTRDSLRKAAAAAVEAGVGGMIVFGIPADKDGAGSGADDPEGISQHAIADIRAEVGDDLVIMADLCLCEYTDHGHCGIVTDDGYVDNDATLERYASTAVAQARAHMVAPSGMMDGQVGAIRKALDRAGFGALPICGYSAKYASAFYGPFREAAEGAPKFGDRATHQQDPANVLEALKEVGLDLAEGADMVMVKPALSYLDVIRRVTDMVHVPVAAYQVSGEFAMIEAAAANGWLDRDKAIMETLTSIRRAGASVILTYWAEEVSRWLG
jgi:porphobilinogen synthase